MKKIVLLCTAFVFSAAAFAGTQETVGFVEAAQPAECSLPAGGRDVKPASEALTPAEQKKQFKARRKLIKKLVKAYRKAPQAQKPAIKAQLAEVVSQGVDAGILYVKARIAAERANLDNWQAKIQAEEADLPSVKAQRVEDLLSGEAKRKHKAAKKAWKKQIKEAKQGMR